MQSIIRCIVSTPFNSYQNATAEFRNHTGCKYYTAAMIAGKYCLKIQAGKQDNIADQIVTARHKLIEENRI